MTITVTVSVNGNYKAPVSYKQGDREFSQVVSGFGRDTPHAISIPFAHGPDALTLKVGPESQDNGEPEAEPGAE